jgi:hypothetical protein
MPAGGWPEVADNGQWLVLQWGSNPSTDYYVRARAQAAGATLRLRHVAEERPTAEDFAPGTRVIIVRYLAGPWVRALHAYRGRLAGIVYLMDDELLDPLAWRTLPGKYRGKLRRHCQAWHRDLAVLATEYWGSTPALCERHRALGMRHMPPLALAEDAGRLPAAVPAQGPVWVFYHGTEAHLEEMRWLQPIVAGLLQAHPRVHFETIGGPEVNRLFRALPRTRILHPMNWPNYLDHCRTLQGHVGLAPLLPSPFNAARSHTKVYDIERCGAVGLYAREGPYAGHVAPERGRLLPMEPGAWRQALDELVARPQD